jgi:protein SCO1/2
MLGLFAAGLAAVAALADGESESLLVDQLGHEVPAASLRGHFLLVYFGYTSCPDVCPTALTTMSRTLDLLGSDGRDVLPLFVTVDPQRDTVDVVRAYVEHFHPRLIGLAGSPAAVAAAQRAFQVSAQRESSDAPRNYLVDHSLFIYLAGPDGKVLKVFHAGQPAAGIAVEVRSLMVQTAGAAVRSQT